MIFNYKIKEKTRKARKQKLQPSGGFVYPCIKFTEIAKTKKKNKLQTEVFLSPRAAK